MPFYEISCTYNDASDHALRDTGQRTLGIVEAASENEARDAAALLVKDLTDANTMNGHSAFPYYNFYFACAPVKVVATVEDILQANGEFFGKSYHWSQKLNPARAEVTDGH